jgi:glycosyltransferase involved in cell wall biosynthesis
MMTRIPYLLRVPGDYAWEQGQQRFGITETLDEFLTHTNHPRMVRLMSKLQAWVARGARHIVVPSDYMKGVVAKWGVDPGRVTRIYSVLKEIHTEAQGPTPFNPLTDTFRIATAARLVPWKGIDTLVAVVATLVEEGFHVSLDIYGDGVKRADLERQVAERGVGKHVTFHGAVTREVLGPALKASHAFVLNTSYEGLSHQLIEVMSLGVPIVTTPVGGNIELIAHEKTGLLVPYNDAAALKSALVRLRQDAQLRIHLGTEAQVKVQSFSEAVIVGEFKKFLQKISENKG